MKRPSPTTIRIWFENLHVSRGRSGGGADILPVSCLSPDDHIHGGLRLEIGGRLVPYLGYWGPDDVCLGDWLRELGGLSDSFSASTTVKYVYDEGEEGQPAFVFERVGESGFFSIADSENSDGVADPAWQQIEFLADEFLAEYTRFLESFRAALRKEAPAFAEEWIHQRCGA